MRVTFFAAAATTFLMGCGLGAPQYPTFGKTSYRIEGLTAAADDGAPATRTVIYRDGPKMRVETVLPNYGQATVVYDQSTNAAYVLNPTGQAPASTVPATQAPAQPPQRATAAEAAPQVIGVAVRIEDAIAPQPLETAWEALGAENARSTGRCEVAGESGREWTPRAAPAPGVERVACISEDGIVLSVSESGRSLWQATSLQRGQQDAALFGVPPGYRLIDPNATAEVISESFERLDSVTGAPPAPPPAREPSG